MFVRVLFKTILKCVSDSCYTAQTCCFVKQNTSDETLSSKSSDSHEVLSLNSI